MKIEVTRREKATIRAALRLYIDIETGLAGNTPGQEHENPVLLQDIATEGGALKPLLIEETCALADRLGT